MNNQMNNQVNQNVNMNNQINQNTNMNMGTNVNSNQNVNVSPDTSANQSTNQNQNTNQNPNVNPGNQAPQGVKPMPKAAQVNPKYTENWLPLKAISNGIMYNNKNEMITGVKIQPRNIFILDQSSMDAALIGLMNFYNTLDFEFWLVVADRPVDIAVYQAELQVLYNKTQDQRIRKMIAQDMQKGEFFVNNNVVDTEYFILFKEKNQELLSKKIRNMINNLASCGLIASQTSNDDLRMIIDNFLNGGQKYEAGGVMPI